MGTIPNHLSYSHLHLLACPYAAWLRYEHALKSPTTPWLTLGTAVHTALERTHTDLGPFSLSNAIDTFKSEYARILEEEEVFISYPQLVKLRNEGVEMLERYDAQIQAGTIKDNPLALETEFEIPIAGTKLVGKIDKLEIDEDGEYIVTDFKTGKSKPEAWDLRHNLQLTTYYWAVFELKGRYPKKVVWHHMRTGELLETERDSNDVDNLKQMITNAISFKVNDIKHRIFHEGVCNHCDFRGQVCTDYELERNLESKVA